MSKSGGFITAPFGPGCYDLRLTSGDLVLFGSASHLAHRMRSLHPDSAGTRNNAGKRVFVGKHISVIAAPGMVDEIPGILEQISRGERIDHYETKRRTKSGKILTVSLTVSPIRDAAGVVIAASKVLRDTTERDVTSDLRERLAAIVESSTTAKYRAFLARPNPLCHTDSKGDHHVSRRSFGLVTHQSKC